MASTAAAAAALPALLRPTLPACRRRVTAVAAGAHAAPQRVAALASNSVASLRRPAQLVCRRDARLAACPPPRRARAAARVSAAAAAAAAASGGTPSGFERACDAFTRLFPLWVALGALVGLTHPPAVAWVKGPLVTGGLAVTMLGMGLTLDADDFARVLRTPGRLAVGVALQYSIMPLLAYTLTRALPLPAPFAVGLILVGSCPGGTASNLVTYIAGANVALSVVLTACSTALAAAATPFFTSVLAGQLVPVPAAGLVASTAQVVLAPVAAGVLLRRFAPRAVGALAPLCAPVAVAVVALICASVIGGSAAAIRGAGALLLGAVVALHAGGFTLGYAASRLAGHDEADARTVSIEVGMQNSALGVVLALAHFADPLTAVPCAVSATVHSCIGSAAAAAWRASDARAGAR